MSENNKKTSIVEDEDSAPEDVSFSTSKQVTIEGQHKIKEHIHSIRENQKQKRIERQEKYIEQKKKKLEKLEASKLSDDILNVISELPPPSSSSSTKTTGIKRKAKTQVKSIKVRFIESELPKSTISDFIPLRSYKNYGISVVNLASVNKKPLIASDSAKIFKNNAFNRPGINRQTAKERLSLIDKKKLKVK